MKRGRNLSGPKNFYYSLGRKIAGIRASFLEGFYSIHVKVRYLHDRTYKNNKLYRDWADKPYSNAIHKLSLIVFVSTFIILSIAHMLTPGLQKVVYAGTNSKTWTTQADFQSATTSLNADTATTPGDLKQTMAADAQPTGNGLQLINSWGLYGNFAWGSAVMDSNKRIHLAENTSNDLVYKTNTSGAWVSTTIDTSIKNSNIALDSSNNSYVCYSKSGYLQYATNNTGTWQIFGLTAGMDSIANDNNCLIALDSNNKIYITYFTGSGTPANTSYIATNASGVWTYTSIVAGGVKITGLAIDSNNKVHLAYNGTYATDASGSWVSTVVNASGQYSSVAIDSNNKAHFSYVVSANPYGVYYANNTTGSWVSETIVSSVTSANYYSTSISLDSANKAYVGYSKTSYQYYSTNQSGSWVETQILVGLNTPLYTNIFNGPYKSSRRDSTGYGYVHMSFASDAGGNHKFYYYNNTPLPYSSPALLGGSAASSIGLRLDAGVDQRVKASSLTWTGSTASVGQKILFKVRAGDSQVELDANACYGPTTLDNGCADWTTAGKFFSQINGQANSATTIPSALASKRYLEVLVRMESDGTNTATLNDVTLNYDTLEPPSNSNLTLTRADNSTLKKSDGTAVTGGIPGAWSNETTLRLNAAGLTCTSCAAAATNLRPEVEIKPVASAFDGTTNLYTATAGNTYVDIPNLTPGTGYHLQVRAIDDQGRVSAWTAYGANLETDPDITVDQTAPTGTVTINAGAAYATSANVTLTLSASDTGGSNISQMQFSNDGTTWSGWETYSTTKAWTLSTGDGSKTVYAQFRDNGGNVVGAPDSNYVTIGTQSWSKYNLNVGVMISGISDQTNNGILEKYCYGENEANCTTYGGLYQWDELMQYSAVEGVQGACPIGSHVPTDSDYKLLEMFLGMTQAQADATNLRGTDQGTQLKAGGTSGFNALLGGVHNTGSGTNYTLLGSHGEYWTSTFFGSYPWNRYFTSGSAGVSRGQYSRTDAFSARCLRDVPVLISDSIFIDSLAPTGSLTVGSGNPAYTATKAVTLFLDPTTPEPGGSGIKEFQLSNDGINWGTAYNPTTATYTAGWQAWSETYRTAGAGYGWNLIKGQSDSGTDGNRTVYIKYRDNAGNVSETPDTTNYVKIGNQVWAKKNLNTGTMVARGGTQSVGQKWCYDNNEANCTTYGGLYQWGLATTPGGFGQTDICPINFHLPTDTEFKTLEIYLGMSQAEADATGLRGTNQGDQLKAAGLCQGRTPCGTSGFDGLLSGSALSYFNMFGYLGSYGFYWSSSNYNSTNAWYRHYYSSTYPTINRNNNSLKLDGMSVRCLKNDSEIPAPTTIAGDTIALDTFAPTVPATVVTSPNGAEKWAGGSSQTITWNKDIIVDNTGGYGLGATPIKIEYTTDGTNYTTIATNEANDGTYTWNPVASLNSTTTKIRITATDTAGYSATDVSDADFTVDSTAPTGTVAINGGATHTTSANVTLSISATDTGGSTLTEMRFSNDGVIWPTWEPYATTKPWALATGDGAKTVYAQFRDGAGNVSGWTQTSNSDFTVSVPYPTAANMTINNNSITLASNPQVGNWIMGVTATPLSGKYVYNSDLSGYAWGSATNCISPYCEIGLDPDNLTYPSFVSPQTNQSLNFSSYPAQNACKLIGGRLPRTNEIYSIQLNQASYGNNFSVSGAIYYWTATEQTASLALAKTFSSGSSASWGETKSSSWHRTRCVSDLLPSFLGAGVFESSIYNATNTSVAYGNTTLGTNIPLGTSLTVSVRGGNTATPDGTWTAYTPIVSGGSASALNGKQYIQYKVEMTGGASTPTFSDITIEAATTASITLDTTPPANITGLSGYTDSGKLTSLVSGNWYTGSAPYFEWTANPDSDLAGYKYCFGTDSNCTPSSNLSSPNYTVTPALSTDGMKYFRLVAYDNAGNTSVSVASFNYGYDPTVPDRVTGLSATTTDIAKVSLAWNAYSDTGAPVDNYKLERVKYLEYLNHAFNLTSDWALGEGYATFTLASNVTTFDDDPISPQQLQTALETSVKYVYRIRVKDVAKTDYSLPQLSPVYGMTQDGKAPDDVTGVVVVSCDGTLTNCFNNANKGFEIKITWSPSIDTGSGVLNYNVYRAYSNPGIPASFTKIGETASPGLVFYDNDALHGTNEAAKLNDYTTYYYRVTATDASTNRNESNLLPLINPFSNSGGAQTPDVTAPTIPTSVVATPMGLDPSGSRQRVNVTWSAATDPRARSTDIGSGVKQYTISRSLTENGSYTPLGTVLSSASLSYNDDNLDEFTYYYYKVTATDNSLNESALSTSSMVRTASNSVPTVPTSVSVTTKKGDPKTDPGVGHTATITYKGSYSKNCLNGVRCITGYEVYRATTNWATSADWLDPAKATKVRTETVLNLFDDRDTTYTFTDTNLADATAYYYKVRTLDNTPAVPDGGPFTSGLSVVSVGTLNAGWDVTPDVTAPMLPLELKVKDIHDDGVSFKRNIVTWKRITTPLRNGVNDFKEYRLYRSNDGLLWTQIKNGDGSNPLYSADKELALASNYYIDLIPLAQANQYYYYYVTAVDDADTLYRYASPNQVTVINGYSNESPAELDGGGLVVAVSVNPAIAKPSILAVSSGTYIGFKAALVSVNVSSAVISWTTDQPADSLVEYRKAGTTNPFIAVGTRNFTISHTVRIFDLDPSTEYEYRIISRNALANDAIATGVELPNITTSGFDILNESVTTTTSTAEIKWNTNLDAASNFVEYQLQRLPGDEPHNGIAGELGNDNPRAHSVVIKGLRSGRNYSYKVKSISVDGYITETPMKTFSTKSYDSDQFVIKPSSSNIAEKNITATSAQIVWTTSMPTTSWVDYGTTSGKYDYSTGDDKLNTNHVVKLENLESGLTYYYRVRVKDMNEVEYTSQEASFKAIAKPIISDVTIKTIESYKVVIAWTTNVQTDTLINWGTTKAYGQRVGKTEKTKNHEITVDSLLDDTEYYYQIIARDEYGNEVYDIDRNLRTPLDKEGPKIDKVKTDIMPLGESDATAQIIISWETNKPSTTLVQYGEGMIGGKYEKSSIEDKSLNTTHTVIIKELNPATTYHFRLVSADKRGNETKSNDYTLVTPSKEKSILQLILKSLEETFSWVRNIGKFFNNLGKKTRSQ